MNRQASPQTKAEDGPTALKAMIGISVSRRLTNYYELFTKYY